MKNYKEYILFTWMALLNSFFHDRSQHEVDNYGLTGHWHWGHQHIVLLQQPPTTGRNDQRGTCTVSAVAFKR